jgi:dephospho-CoA kinase
MLHVGLTGNVASGKSSVARHFSQWGATVIDSDRLVHEVQRPGSEVLAAIVRRFGNGVMRSDGSLDRAVLRRSVMGNDTALASLNAIVHPAVGERRAHLLREAQSRGDRVVVSDVPLLFEVLDPREFDVIVLVHAPIDLRRQRLIDQRGIDPEEVDRLLASQIDSETKRDRSNIIIENDGTLADLEERSREAWDTLQALAARGSGEAASE